MPVRVLCTGDIHIGRQTSKTRVPYRTADAWTAIVDLAIDRNTDLVALGGDVVDRASKSFEALGPLLQGLERLADNDIPVVAVAGNHDWDILPRLATQSGFDHLKLLGASGLWEHRTIRRGNRDLLQVIGWSFPSIHVPLNPMMSVDAVDRNNLPVLGIVHTDLGSVTSKYAPSTVADFAGHDVDFWLLGHIHLPRRYDEQRLLVPGSPFAMDPGESGAHGVWMLTLDEHGMTALESIPLSPVEYAVLVVDLTDVADEGAFQSAATEKLRKQAETTSARELSVRIRFEGETPSHASIERWASLLQQDSSRIEFAETTVSIDTVTVDARPPVDLGDLSQGNDPAAEVAKLIIALEADELAPEYSQLLSAIGARLDRVGIDGNFAQLERSDMPEVTTRKIMTAKSWKLLSAMIATKGQA